MKKMIAKSSDYTKFPVNTLSVGLGEEKIILRIITEKKIIFY